MKHFRILEKKDINKEYTIQYLKKLFFGLFYWKNVDNTKYYKYEEAFNEVKKMIKQEDYDNLSYGYHYIDAYKIFKVKNDTTPNVIEPKKVEKKKTETLEEIKVNEEIREEIKEETPKRPTKSGRKNVNKSVFVPRK